MLAKASICKVWEVGECMHAWFVKTGNCGDPPYLLCKKPISHVYTTPSLPLSLRTSKDCVRRVCGYGIINVWELN